MSVKTKPSGACPTFFRACCWTASQGGDSGYDAAAYELFRGIGGLAGYDTEDDDWREKLQELSDLFSRPTPGGMVRGWGSFITSPDADAVIAWLRRELPRCMELVPPRRHQTFLRGAFRYVVEDENDLTNW